jgi:hypothetical protein
LKPRRIGPRVVDDHRLGIVQQNDRLRSLELGSDGDWMPDDHHLDEILSWDGAARQEGLEDSPTPP